MRWTLLSEPLTIKTNKKTYESHKVFSFKGWPDGVTKTPHHSATVAM